MTFKESLRVCLKEKYARFSGRVSRSEFWWFMLFGVLVGVITGIMDTVFGTFVVTGVDKHGNVKAIGIISTIFSLILLLPTLSVSARRLHDRNMTGWLLLLPFALIF